MKLLKLIAAASVAAIALGAGAAFGSDALPFSQTIYVVNASSNLSNAGLAADLTVFETVANRDFTPAWNLAPVKLVLQDDVNQLPPHAWVIFLYDQPDCLFCAGYHTARGSPYAVVGTQAGLNWQVVFSHELFEMLVDPYVDLWISTYYCNPFAGCYPTAFYNYEVCDPVPSFGYGYWEQGVRISDFVLPSWFNRQGSQKLDFMGFLHHALKVAPHGYLGRYVPDSKVVFKR